MDHMMHDTIEVEINLTAAREQAREEGDRRWNEYIPHIYPSDTPEITTDERMKAIERWMDIFTRDHNPH